MTEAEKLMQYVREAVERGQLSAEDLEALCEYARMILNRRVENHQTSGEEEQTATE